jgi:cellobiose-specific phosphotransferase system component IIA
MPTKHARLTVVVTDEVMGMLDHLSMLTGNSKSAMVGDLLSSSMGTFSRMASLLEAAKDLSNKAHKEQQAAQRALSTAHDRLETALGVAQGHFDTAVTKIARRARRPVGGVAGGATANGPRHLPPISNRGVNIPKTSQKHNTKKAKGH